MGVIVDSCNKVDKEGLLIKLIDKKLDADGEEEVLSHLRACPECLAKMARVLLSDDELQEVFLADQEEGLPFFESAETGDAANDVPSPYPLETPEEPKQDTIDFKDGPILVEDLPVGASIKHNIYDGGGKLLIASNTTLTKGIIESVKRRGLTTVTIKSPKAKY